jgi:hypothetical protein
LRFSFSIITEATSNKLDAFFSLDVDKMEGIVVDVEGNILIEDACDCVKEEVGSVGYNDWDEMGEEIISRPPRLRINSSISLLSLFFNRQT